MLEAVRVSLVVRSAAGTPDPAHGLARLRAAGLPDLPGAVTGPPENAAETDLLEVQRAAVAGLPDPDSALAGLVEQGLVRAAGWLRGVPAAAVGELRAEGFVVWVLVAFWPCTSEQPTVFLPGPFVAACGGLGLPICLTGG